MITFFVDMGTNYIVFVCWELSVTYAKEYFCSSHLTISKNKIEAVTTICAEILLQIVDRNGRKMKDRTRCVSFSLHARQAKQYMTIESARSFRCFHVRWFARKCTDCDVILFKYS